ncbi:cytochrome b/b6 domain-containing protein [bacterium]|nr:cytochrome b/b6 domain-containing protein [bacterium]
MNKVYFYSWYERLWHWTQAALITLLLLTGLLLHSPGTFRMFDFALMVSVHNVLAALLIINAGLGLFYYLTTGAIRQFLLKPQNLVGIMLKQLRYYAYGIFRGEEYPYLKEPRQRLNPLQRVTYLMILNILLPVQVVTGVLSWGAQHWPATVAALGGLPVLALVHTLAAWLFGAFIIMHIYLTTTGHSPLANIWAMLSGWEMVVDNSTTDREVQHGKAG